MTAVTENIAGRSIPRNPPRAEPCDVQFFDLPGGGVLAVCEPCDMQWHLEDGHTDAELARFTAQHQGDER